MRLVIFQIKYFRIELKPKPALVKVMQLDSNWLNEWYSENSESGRYDTEGIAYATVKFIWLKKALVLFWKLGLVVTFIGRLVLSQTGFFMQKVLDESFSGIKNAGLEAIACHSEKIRYLCTMNVNSEWLMYLG